MLDCSSHRDEDRGMLYLSGKLDSHHTAGLEERYRMSSQEAVLHDATSVRNLATNRLSGVGR